MNAGILDAVQLAASLELALAGKVAALDEYSAQRRPIALEIVALADRLTRVATVRRNRRVIRNVVMKLLSAIPAVRRGLAMRLSGLVYR